MTAASRLSIAFILTLVVSSTAAAQEPPAPIPVTGLILVNPLGINTLLPGGHLEGLGSQDPTRAAGMRFEVFASAGCQQLTVCALGIDTSAIPQPPPGLVDNQAPRFVSQCRVINTDVTQTVAVEIPKATNVNQHLDAHFLYGSQQGTCFIQVRTLVLP
jgi:hypothetical protein